MGCTESKPKRGKSFEKQSKEEKGGVPKELKREKGWEGECGEWDALLNEAKMVQVRLREGKVCALSDIQDNASSDGEVPACIVIQRWYRKLILHRKWETMFYRRIWQLLDRWDERNIAAAVPRSPGLTRTKSTSDIAKIANDKAVRTSIDSLSAGIPFSPKILKELLIAGADTLRKVNNVQEVTPKDRSWKGVVVGDLHGQLQDLIRILKVHGTPVPGQLVYIFNGDYVDRGPHGCEVVGLILMLYLAYPGAVFVNRGNHEDDVVASGHNFYSEVMQKYDSDMYQLFVNFFETLPLCTLVNNTVLIVHGGVPRHNETLEYINGLDRFGPVPLCGRRDTNKDRNIICDLLWSDPSKFTGSKFNCMRGQGMSFGPDITKKFCAAQSPPLSHVIRSHECQQQGYSTSHNGMLSTVFSASDYAGVETNRGAVIVLSPLDGGEVDIAYHQFKVHASALTAHQPPRECKNLIIKAEVLRMLREVVGESQHGLMVAFNALDKNLTGRVSVREWSGEMRKLVRVPWAALQKDILINDSQNTTEVSYIKLLRNVSCPYETVTAETWLPYFMKWVFHFAKLNGTLYVAGEPDLPVALFKFFCNKSNSITYQSFHQLVTTELSCGICDRMVLLMYLQLVEENRPGIDLETWMRAYHESEGKSILTTHLKTGNVISSNKMFCMWDLWLLDRFREPLIKIRDPVTAFRFLDSLGTKRLGIENLQATIEKMQLNMDLSKTTRFTTVCLGESDSIESIATLFGVPPSSLSPVDNHLDIQTWPLSPTQLESWTRSAHLLPPSPGDVIETPPEWSQTTVPPTGELPKEYRRPAFITYRDFVSMWVCHGNGCFRVDTPKKAAKQVDDVLGAWLQCTP